MHFSKELYYYVETRAKDIRSSDFSREARNPDIYRKLQCLNVKNKLKKKTTSFLKHYVGKNRHTDNTQTHTRMHTQSNLWVRFSLQAFSLRTLPYAISYNRSKTFSAMPKLSSPTNEDRKGET